MKVRIGTPLPNDIECLEECTKSVIKLIDTYKDIQWERVEIHSALIANNRNEIVNYNDMDFDYLLFVDSDISFSPESFKTLLDTNVPFISGTYELRDGTPSGWSYKRDWTKIYPEKTEIIANIEAVGLGFCLIHQDVFKKMREMYVKTFFYYPWLDHLGSYSGEDLGFCINLRRIGIPVLMHQQVYVWHWMKNTIPGGM